MNSFHNEIENTKYNLIKNAYSQLLIDKFVIKYLDYKLFGDQNQKKDTCDVYYFTTYQKQTFKTLQRVL